MALKGSYSTNTGGASSDKYPRYLTLTWSATQSIANNTSTISYTIKAGGTSTSSYVKAAPITVKNAGETVYSKTDRFKLYSNLEIINEDILKVDIDKFKSSHFVKINKHKNSIPAFPDYEHDEDLL